MRHAAPIALAALVTILLAAGCATTPGGPPKRNGSGPLPGPPTADSLTVGLWHLEETSGTSVADSGPRRLETFAGRDTRVEFGRFGSARRFTRSIDSFLYVPWTQGLETGGAITVEAWIQPAGDAPYEGSLIAARWTRLANQQSWLLGLVGAREAEALVTRPSPGDLASLIRTYEPGTLFFAFQPEAAAEPVTAFSTIPVESDRWTHVAATYDGAIVRLFIDGRLDAQYAHPGRIRPTDAPLVVGNLIDPRWIVEFQGSVRIETADDDYPYYAFDGSIDELRISSVARGMGLRGDW